ncbi:CinA family protein [Kitasatospora paranensis]|uniref:CinA family protein n=1 Tax=Kitasatospora paranensis TaxID=258053 RepID=A0ABW2FYB8_9ACTN
MHAALRAQGATVAVAESLTGGLLAAALVDVPGASATFRGSVTAYATELKASVLGVDEGLLAVHGPVHPVVARQMADGVRRLLGATYGLATTGVAGPEAQDGLPVGTVHVGFAGPGGTQVVSPVLSGQRARIRGTTVTVALELLLDRLASPSRPR